MESVLENCFVVYKRHWPHRLASPHQMEEPLAACESYAEARRVLDQLRRSQQDGVIRFQGCAGGSD
jgi:hypothetical protein